MSSYNIKGEEVEYRIISKTEPVSIVTALICLDCITTPLVPFGIR